MIEHVRGTHDSINFDLSFILRNIKKWLFASLCFACICGVTGFVFMDSRAQDVYSAKVLVTIAGQNNNVGLLTDNNLKSALNRNVSMWNSTAMRKAIIAADPDGYAYGYLSASILEGTGMIELTATAYSAKGAFYTLNGAIRNYRQVSPNFDTSYRTVILTSISPDDITCSSSTTWPYGPLGFAGGLFLSLGVVVLWSMITDLLHSEEQARRVLASPMLGTLTEVKEKDAPSRKLLWNRNKLPMEYLEDMDMLATRIEQTMHHDNQKILMITSAFPNDGKTTVSSNLAQALAERNRKVLLIEMDLRNPSLQKVFRPQSDAEEMEWFYAVQKKQRLSRYIIPCETNENLDIIYQFQPVRDSDSFIENSTIRAKIRNLSNAYDYVILDTPPLGIVRDTEVIARIADCSLLVTRQDICYARVMNDCIDRVETAGASCVGVVLNQCRGISLKAPESERGKHKDRKNHTEHKEHRERKENKERKERKAK